MAKAAVKGKAPAGKAKVKAKAKGKAGGTPLWLKIFALILLFPFAAVLLPTTLLFFIMMAPTWVAYITDRSREKQLAIAVGMLNFAGTLPAIIDLWTRGQNHQTAMNMIGDVFVWVIAYGAAFAGWLIFAFMPTVVGSYYRMTTDTRIKGLVKQQKALIAEWGNAVAEGIGLAVPVDDDAEEAEDSEAEADDEDEDVTEAELVQPRAAR
jgi:hypothetical protein